MPYNAAACYWIVSNRSAPDNIFSSASGTYVSSSDAGYQAFLATGDRARGPILDGELTDVLVKAGVSPAICAAAGITELSVCGVGLTEADVRSMTQYVGCQVVSGGASALSGTYGIELADEDNYLGLQAGIAASAPWIGYVRDTAGVKHTMTAPQATEVLIGILGFMEALDGAIGTWAGGGSWSAPSQPVGIA